MLGLGDVGRPTTNNYDYGRRPFWLQSVQCNGTEKSIAECVGNDPDVHDCSSGEEQAVSCLTEGAVALFGGGHPRQGRLEVYHNSTWGTVCDDYFTTSAARAVCNSLGFGYGGYMRNAINYGLGTGRIWLDNVRCNGSKRHFSECSHSEWGVHNCGHDEDIAVLCFGNWTSDDDHSYVYDYSHDIAFAFFPIYTVVFVLVVFCIVPKMVTCCERRRVGCCCCCKGQEQRIETVQTQDPASDDVEPNASSTEPSTDAAAEPTPRYDQVLLVEMLCANSIGRANLSLPR